jgi:hypothetical protein
MMGGGMGGGMGRGGPGGRGPGGPGGYQSGGMGRGGPGGGRGMGMGMGGRAPDADMPLDMKRKCQIMVHGLPFAYDNMMLRDMFKVRNHMRSSCFAPAFACSCTWLGWA